VSRPCQGCDGGEVLGVGVVVQVHHGHTVPGRKSPSARSARGPEHGTTMSRARSGEANP
jgi:hypothetical protein